LNKSKSRIFVLLVFITVAFFVFFRGISPMIAKRHRDSFLKHCPKYELEVVFYPEDKILDAEQRLFFINNTNYELKELYFHLYPNAFKSLDSAPFPQEEYNRAYPEGFAPGYLDIKDIIINLKEVNYEVEDTLLKVILDKPLKPQNSLQIDIDFSALIPPSRGRYGYGQDTYNIANWYPILAVCDEQGWHKEPYYSIGDPFYSDIAVYDVTIKVPKAYTIAASGSLEERHLEGEFYRWKFKTELVRDFAWIASSRFDISQTQLGKTVIKSYYIDEDKQYGKQALEYGKRAINFFNGYFGLYPYDDFSIVAADFYIGGMEYPNLVMIGRQFYADQDLLEYIVVHETAHQWWYGLVGNDEVREPWLDEALTEYSTILYYENVYGKRVGRKVYEETILEPYKIFESEYGAEAIARPLPEFSSWREYGAIVYSRGAIMLKELERRMGKGKLQDAMIYYFKQNQYKNATADDFIEALNHVSGVDWRPFIEEWLEGKEELETVA